MSEQSSGFDVGGSIDQEEVVERGLVVMLVILFGVSTLMTFSTNAHHGSTDQNGVSVRVDAKWVDTAGPGACMTLSSVTTTRTEGSHIADLICCEISKDEIGLSNALSLRFELDERIRRLVEVDLVKWDEVGVISKFVSYDPI